MRKLAIAAFSFSAAIFAANYIFSRDTALYAALLCALAGAAVLGVRLKSLRGLVVAAFAASIGFAVFAAHYDLTVSKAHRLAGQTRGYTFSLLENPQDYGEYVSVHARLEGEGFPRLKCVLYASDGNMDAIKGGDRITAELKLSAADIRYGLYTSRYNAKDIYLTGTVKGAIGIIGHRAGIASISSLAAEKIARRTDDVYDSTTASFLKALMIGDKRDLYDDDALYVALSRAGLMHVAAVSGMHVSFLIAFLRFVFGKGKRSALFCILLAWAYVAVSGMSPSAARAAFMQTMLLLAPLFERENDTITSLSAALGVLLLINPFAAADVSLQLSFAAMLGIVLFFEKLQELLMQPLGEGRAAAILRYPTGILTCTMSVMVFTLPISAYYFGYVAVLSPLTNLLCLWAVPLSFVGAFASLCFSWIPFAGKLLVFAETMLVRYLTAVCRYISSIGFSAVYMPERLTLVWAIVFYLTLAAVFLFRLKAKYKLLVPLTAAILGLLVPQAVMRSRALSAEETVAAIDVGQGQCISVACGGRTVMIDCGSTSYAEYNAGECAAAYLKSRGTDRIDVLVFTHLHADHANGYKRLAELMEIGKVVIPASTDRSDPRLWEIILSAKRHGTKVEFVSQCETESCGEMRLILFADGTDGNENERCMPVLVSAGNRDVIITGDAPASREKELVEKYELPVIEVLVVGHHGSKSASCEEYLAAAAGGRAIISVGKNNYGMPSPEVLERLESFGYTICRTDQSGSVEIRFDG